MKVSQIILTLVLFLFTASLAFAQSGPGFGVDVDDTGAAPIPGILAAIAAGLFIGGRKLYLNNKK